MNSWDRVGGALCAALLAATTASHTAIAQEAPIAAVPGEIDPRALALAREIIAAGFPETQRASLFGGSLDTAFKQLGELNVPELDKSPELKAIVTRHVADMQGDLKQVVQRHIPFILDAVSIAYAREFSVKELGELKAFVSGPTGQRFFSRSAAMMGDPAVAAANRALMQDAMAVATPMRKALEAEVLEYLVDHPETAKAIAEGH